MSVSLWRIAADTPSYVADDTSGAGAEKTGGRWNAIGTPMLYTSPTIALAVLETMVHLGAGALPLNRFLVRLDVPDAVWKGAARVDPVGLVGWNAVPSGRVSIDWGNAWCAARPSAIALVPSVVVPEEFNALINPRHPEAAKITARKIRRWDYDSRVRNP